MISRTDLYAVSTVMFIVLARYASWFMEHVLHRHHEATKPRVIDLNTSHAELEAIFNIVIPHTQDYPGFRDLQVVDSQGNAISSVQSVNLDTGEIIVKLRSLNWHVMDLSKTWEAEPVAIRLGLRYIGIKINGKIEFSQNYNRPRTVGLETT